MYIYIYIIDDERLCWKKSFQHFIFLLTVLLILKLKRPLIYEIFSLWWNLFVISNIQLKTFFLWLAYNVSICLRQTSPYRFLLRGFSCQVLWTDIFLRISLCSGSVFVVASCPFFNMKLWSVSRVKSLLSVSYFRKVKILKHEVDNSNERLFTSLLFARRKFLR